MEAIQREEATHRERLLAAMSDAVVETGYDALSVAEVVRRARTSKRTFYEHFAGKEDCLLALYEAKSAHVIAVVEEALRNAPAGEAHAAERVETGVAVYLAELQERPAVLRTVIIAILRSGPRGLAVRRAVNRQYAALLLQEMEAAGRGGPHAAAVAAALVGGINELLLEAVEEECTGRLTELVAPVTALLRPFFAPAP